MQSGKIHLSARICGTASVTRQIYSQKHIQTGEASLVEWSISKASLNGMKKGISVKQNYIPVGEMS